MANISKRNRRREREIRNAARNRREIIAARLNRRDMTHEGRKIRFYDDLIKDKIVVLNFMEDSGVILLLHYLLETSGSRQMRPSICH